MAPPLPGHQLRAPSDKIPENRPPPAPTSALGLILRLTWMAYGSLALPLLAVLIVQGGDFSALDVAFWALVGALVWVRYIDVTRFGGLTAEGEPASLQDWRRYTGYLFGASSFLWVVTLALRRWL